MKTTPIKTIIYTTLTDKLVQEWEELWAQHPNKSFVNSPKWCMAVVETFGYTTYTIVTVYKGNVLVAVAPLIASSLYGVRVRTLPPADYGCGATFLVEDTDTRVLQTFISALLEQGCVVFDNIPEVTVDTLHAHTTAVSHCVTSPNYLYDIQKDEQGKVVFEKRTKFLYKARKTLSQFSLKTFEGTNAEGFNFVFSIDVRSRKQERGYNTFTDPMIQTFYKTLGAYFKKALTIHVLFFESTPIAYEIGFHIGSTYVGSQFAFDGTYKHYAPGKVLIALLIETLGNEGVRILNCGSGDSHLKRAFSSHATSLSTVILTKNKWVRVYLECIQALKTNIFSFLQHQPRLYSAYKTIQHTVGLAI